MFIFIQHATISPARVSNYREATWSCAAFRETVSDITMPVAPSVPALFAGAISGLVTWRVLSGRDQDDAHFTKKSLRHRTVLITGGGSGVGRLTALAFARGGVSNVVLWDLNPDGLRETSELIRKETASASSSSSVVQCREDIVDVSDPSAVYRAAENVAAWCAKRGSYGTCPTRTCHDGRTRIIE